MGEKCKFSVAWVGKCNQPANAEGFCEKHEPMKCCSCGEQATRECEETMQFVCGFPLCDNCEHTIQSNGCNSRGELPEGMKGHCRKHEQVYKPWYMKQENQEEKVIKEELDKEAEKVKNPIRNIYTKLTNDELLVLMDEIEFCEKTGAFPANSNIREVTREVSKIIGSDVSSNLLLTQVSILRECAIRWKKNLVDK